jgi:hypothetical protein
MPGRTVSPVNGKVVICSTAKYSGVGVSPYTCYGWLVKDSQDQDMPPTPCHMDQA